MNYYHLLGVNVNATTNEIQDAYYNLLRRYELTKDTDTENQLNIETIKKAYETLIDPEKRIAYDKYLLNSISSSENYANHEHEKMIQKYDEDQLVKKIKQLHTNTVYVSVINSVLFLIGSILIIIAGFIVENNYNVYVGNYYDIYQNTTFTALYAIGISLLVIWLVTLITGYIIALVQINRMPNFFKNKNLWLILSIIGLVCTVVGLGVVSWILMIVIAITSRKPEQQFYNVVTN